MTFTTGRAAQPLAFLYTAHDLDHLRDAGNRIMQICGAKRDMKMLNMFPYAPHLAFWLSHYAGTEFGVMMVSSGGGKVSGTDGNLRIMIKLAPEVLIGMPTFIYHVLQAAISRNLRCPQLSKIILGGEKAPPGMRRKLKSLAAQLGAPQVDVLMTYGFTEAKMAWPECPYPEGEQSGRISSLSRSGHYRDRRSEDRRTDGRRRAGRDCIHSRSMRAARSSCVTVPVT